MTLSDGFKGECIPVQIYWELYSQQDFFFYIPCFLPEQAVYKNCDQQDTCHLLQEAYR